MIATEETEVAEPVELIECAKCEKPVESVYQKGLCKKCLLDEFAGHIQLINLFRV